MSNVSVSNMSNISISNISNVSVINMSNVSVSNMRNVSVIIMINVSVSNMGNASVINMSNVSVITLSNVSVNSMIDVSVSNMINVSVINMSNASVSNMTNVSVSNMSNVSVSNMSNVSISNMSNVSVSNMSNVSVSNMSNVSVSNMSNVSVSNMSNVSVSNMTNVSVSNMSNVSVSNMSNVSISNMSNVSVSNMSNVSVSNMSNVSVSNMSNVSVSNMSDVSVSNMSNVSVSNMSNVSVSNMSNVSVSNISNVSVINMSNASISNMSNVSVSNMSNVSVINMSNVSVINMSNASISNMSNVSVSNMSNVSVSNMSNVSVSNMSNVSVSNMSNVSVSNMSNVSVSNMSNVSVRSPDACSDQTPIESLPESGRSEFSMIRLDVTNLTVDIANYTFASKSGTHFIRYATAGDKFASTPKCYPRGGFKIDLTGTPFLLSRLVQWTWQGTVSSGNVSAGSANITDSSYIGCFEDGEKRILSEVHMNDDQRMTPQFCIDHCRQYGFQFAGVEFRYECFCGNEHDLYESKPDSECKMPCSGDAKQFCGGDWRVSVFSTELVQVVEGHCGGFPGLCFPSLKGNPNNSVLALDIDYTHPCIVSNPCQNEGRCIATTPTDFACQCYRGYGGELCEQLKGLIVIGRESCPLGFQPESCQCEESRCSGAIFRTDKCVTSTGNTRITCRYGDPGYVVLFNVDGEGQSNPSCPSSSNIISCSYWSNSSWQGSNGQGQIRENTCYADGCADCKKQARCKEYRCGCQNGGLCSPVTGLCTCLMGYYGEKCETFDYCRYYTDKFGASACGSGGVCRAVPKNRTRAYGGDHAGSHCIFPFDYAGLSFQNCIDDNSVGPPFACGGYFQGPTSYIDLGQWSPGATYTLAVWVKPYKSEYKRRTIVGGTADCNDWGINLNDFSFRGYVNTNPSSCSTDLDTISTPPVQVGQWYMVALVNNGTHARAYVNGALRNTVKVTSYHLATTTGSRIGGEFCCPENEMNGLIKTVKIWNHALDPESLNNSMYTQDTSKSPYGAIYNGLVGHWELGEEIPQACIGTYHEGADWILQDGQIISGTHCEIRRFHVPIGVTVTIQHYTGTSGGKVAIYAKAFIYIRTFKIDGYIDGVGAGYRGGKSAGLSRATGTQGETYNGGGIASYLKNNGGGGGGMGSSVNLDFPGQAGGGGGYGTTGSPGVKTYINQSDSGYGGRVYGDSTLTILYMGSGGGSGGNAMDLKSNPIGGRGGNGGGAIRLVASKSVIITGLISVEGENGEGDEMPGPGCHGCPHSCSVRTPTQCSGNNTDRCWDLSGPGGGGSGGSIFISGKLVDVGYKKVRASGGKGGGGANGRCGGNGGMGRIRVDSDVFKGTIGNEHGLLYQQMLANTFIDHSQVGQSQIDYRTTVYGNEVYRGCFEERNINDRFLAKQIQLSDIDAAKMTPTFCQSLCRKRGFMFSGTQYARECFCDNHLDMSRKRPDSECSTPCSGDPHQTCGGSNRIQILGPPPAVPAIGYNIYSKCDEWCVTADAATEKVRINDLKNLFFRFYFYKLN
ncbi:hypothetical protein ACJMK2_021556 [Sinanodonta woodiana]|uniref:Uncharacterized protein n=1 Tax=Sinanodonta woodiana TaxID=1069815 RepID=A0ABD3TIW4_SINWO